MEEKIKKIFLKHINKSDINYNLIKEEKISTFFDSLDFVEFLIDIEEVFLIEISDKEIYSLKNLKDLENLILKKL